MHAKRRRDWAQCGRCLEKLAIEVLTALSPMRRHNLCQAQVACGIMQTPASGRHRSRRISAGSQLVAQGSAYDARAVAHGLRRGENDLQS